MNCTIIFVGIVCQLLLVSMKVTEEEINWWKVTLNYWR
jgi:hypothetical protein